MNSNMQTKRVVSARVLPLSTYTYVWVVNRNMTRLSFSDSLIFPSRHMGSTWLQSARCLSETGGVDLSFYPPCSFHLMLTPVSHEEHAKWLCPSRAVVHKNFCPRSWKPEFRDRTRGPGVVVHCALWSVGEKQLDPDSRCASPSGVEGKLVRTCGSNNTNRLGKIQAWLMMAHRLQWWRRSEIQLGLQPMGQSLSTPTVPLGCWNGATGPWH